MAVRQILYFDPEGAKRANTQIDDLSSALAEIESATSVEAAFVTALRYIPADRFPYATLTKVSPRHEPLASTFPRDWAVEYMEKLYAQNDPIIWLILQQSTWFGWDKPLEMAKAKGLRSKAQHVMCASRDHGLRDGICVPFHGAGGYHSSMVLCGPDHAADMSPRDSASILAVVRALQFRVAALQEPERQTPQDVPALSERELATLRLAADGKTDEDIAQILGLSGHTVSEYMRGAIRKLNAQNRTNAVVLAIAAGYLSIV